MFVSLRLKRTSKQNRTEQNRTEQSRTEQNRAEQNRAEQNRTYFKRAMLMDWCKLYFTCTKPKEMFT